MNETITLRRATIKDADILLEWRNDPETRKASHNTAEVQRSDHVSWLSRTLGNPIVGYTSPKKMVTLSALFERILRMVYGNCHGRYPREQEGGEWRSGWLLYWQTKSQNQ